MRFLQLIVCLIVLSSCKNPQEVVYSDALLSSNREYIDENAAILEAAKANISDTAFVNLRDYGKDFFYDMKYATEDNFLKTKVYDCAECYLRFKTVKALIKANQAFLKLGYKIKVYDCYRPLDVQKKMWAITPNPTYVADPAKGSIHNRGGAVDITLTDYSGNELDMGTGFDHFGPEAAHDYKNISAEAATNRKILKEIMLKNGFRSFASEWWHYNLMSASTLPVSNFTWDCKN
ncbi:MULTISPECIES: D-alanyl-D-alanine dipeptidase [Flavobacterium]|uniref:D-alanyl-D-alanine dipeptidase n=1 Tax=Flavobacterium lindanitolerans TaxID=428988 RepID=A0A497UC43_9FLAO|nr:MULTISPECIES: D-alanyl-D-alanine dipeptidase [Flavobacterium]MDQ7960933.1 D-alanyl-D-alanine dipeptidase [Flavobacterium lindanitolerans]OJX55787.1 MAG: peptidase M15 [Flavobacterium sp. 38-13]PKW20651.1 D-alanyl-D-alanine dipeptidase [Flavobacterium lindanitolerans]RLJ24094.1 D-alanyl-D-alanine dipeptidase [Flavobacterium lindanitolerans]